MHLDEEDQAAYEQLDGNQQKELSDIHSNTEFWLKLPKFAALGIVCFIVISAIF